MEVNVLREAMCDIGRRAYARELVDGTAGNFSARLPDGNVLCTPTMFCKGMLSPGDLCIVDLAGRQLSGDRRASTEILMHLAVYAAGPAVQAVVHTHPPYATTLALRGETLPEGLLPEGDVFLGPVPLIPYALTGTGAMGEALGPHATRAVAALLQNHGAVTWGPDLETAYCLTETLEAVARIACQARLLGGYQQIPAEGRSALVALRERVRLGWRGAER